jgi:Na+(H+)/acetate symporter ActP
MDRLTVAKVAFAFAGIGIFAYGVRADDNVIRWVGIAFVIVAFLLRFARRRDRDTTG